MQVGGVEEAWGRQGVNSVRGVAATPKWREQVGECGADQRGRECFRVLTCLLGAEGSMWQPSHQNPGSHLAVEENDLSLSSSINYTCLAV